MDKKLNLIVVAFSSLIATASFAATPCKSYVRLDLGYGISGGATAYGNQIDNNSVRSTSFSPHMDERGMIGDIALGYGFSDTMRGEISFDFKPKMKMKYHYFAVENEEYGGSAKVFYDFNNNTSITPFVFGGLGALSIKPKISPYINLDNSYLGTAYLAQINSSGEFIVDGNNNIITYSSLTMPSQTVMTYQAGFGLAFKTTEDISLDLTYGLGGKTNYKFLNNIAGIAAMGEPPLTEDGIEGSEKLLQMKLKNQLDQSFNLGVRFTM